MVRKLSFLCPPTPHLIDSHIQIRCPCHISSIRLIFGRHDTVGPPPSSLSLMPYHLPLLPDQGPSSAVRWKAGGCPYRPGHPGLSEHLLLLLRPPFSSQVGCYLMAPSPLDDYASNTSNYHHLLPVISGDPTHQELVAGKLGHSSTWLNNTTSNGTCHLLQGFILITSSWVAHNQLSIAFPRLVVASISFILQQPPSPLPYPSFSFTKGHKWRFS